MSVQDIYFSRYVLFSNDISGRTATGEVVYTPSVKQASKPCYLTCISDEEKTIYGKRNILVTHLLIADPVADILSSDLVLSEGKTYQIVNVESTNTPWLQHMELKLLEVSGPQTMPVVPPQVKKPEVKP